MKKLLATALIVLLVGAAPRPANAQLGVSIVYDPANFKSAVLRYLQLLAQLRQLQATYAQVLNHYNLAVQMSRNIPNMASRYGTSSTPWRYASAHDLYGNATPWLNGVNSGFVPAVLSGYQKATSTLQSYSQTLLSSMPQSEVQRLEADAATVELVDGAAQNALEAIGAIRANAVSTTSTIRNIQSDSLSSNANLNTEVGVLNKVNATSVLSLQNAQDTNKLLVALLEQQTILSKQLRDASTNITNADINRRQNTVAFGQQLTGNIGQTLNSYRLP
jgi:hypothetical protein